MGATMIANHEANRALEDVHVNAEALVYFSNEMFREREEMTYEEVCELCLELREELPARVKHVLDNRKYCMSEFEKISHQMRDMMLALKAIHRHSSQSTKSG